jgi:hypothetical protein
MSDTQWQKIARQFSEMDDARIRVVFPVVAKVLKAYRCTKILDFGCGDAGFGNLALSEGIGVVDMYDPSEAMRSLARTTTGAWAGRTRVFDTITDIGLSSYDAVVWNAVWMCLGSRSQCISALTDSVAVLRSGGMFLASVSHPGFLDREFSTYRTSFKVENYFREGGEYEVTMFDKQSVLQFIDFHWSLGEMVRQMREVRLQLCEIIEIGDRCVDDVSNGVPWLLFVAQSSPTRLSLSADAI